jgi:hypothetical protein
MTTANFWALDDGEVVGANDTIEVEGGNGGIMPMPDGTEVRVGIQDAKWENAESEGDYINIKYQVLAPACYKGRIIFQKLHIKPNRQAKNNVGLSDEKFKAKRAKALRMFAVIDTNAGGKLLASPEAPTDDKLQINLVAKTMMLKLGVYVFDMKDGVKIPHPADYNRGNWVRKVAPKAAFVDMSKEDQEAAVARSAKEYADILAAPGDRAAPQQSGGGSRPAPQQQQRQAAPQPGNDFDSFDDDIPF